jgi:hypothetical protein
MTKHNLVYTQQHEVDNRLYTIKVYKGQALRNAEYDFKGKHYEEVVEIKAFRVVVKCIEQFGNGRNKSSEHDFGYLTSRAGEFMSLLREMKETCEDLDDMKRLVVSLEKRFRVALDRDAISVLKKRLYLYGTNPASKHTKCFPYY